MAAVTPPALASEQSRVGRKSVRPLASVGLGLFLGLTNKDDRTCGLFGVLGGDPRGPVARSLLAVNREGEGAIHSRAAIDNRPILQQRRRSLPAGCGHTHPACRVARDLRRSHGIPYNRHLARDRNAKPRGVIHDGAHLPELR